MTKQNNNAFLINLAPGEYYFESILQYILFFNSYFLVN